MNCPKYMQAKYCLCSAFIQFLETIKISELFWTIFFLVRICQHGAYLAGVFYNVNYVNVNYSVKNSTVDCKYLLFLQDFFFRLKPKQYKKCQPADSLKKTSGQS